MNTSKRYKLIACEIMFREVCFCASMCKNIIDISFMPKGLHDVGDVKMLEKLQSEMDSVDVQKYDAILLCYGLCNNGIKGLHSTLPLIVPKAHDCITLLLGSRDKYNNYFRDNPGTFYKSPGWIERDVNPNENEQSVTSQLGMNKTYQEYVEQYGEENAEYLMETLGNWFNNYSKIAYIDTKTGNFEYYKELAKQQANERKWEYEEVEGNTNLIFRLLNGEWENEDFLIVPPNNRIEPTYTEDIVSYAPIT
ncbi:MAG TPA: DUF1638 domain-containing protein [Clostridia bacterium]|nr:DUF1638 domain-containing protein [Clostridia bacterium]